MQEMVKIWILLFILKPSKPGDSIAQQKLFLRLSLQTHHDPHISFIRPHSAKGGDRLSKLNIALYIAAVALSLSIGVWGTAMILSSTANTAENSMKFSNGINNVFLLENHYGESGDAIVGIELFEGNGYNPNGVKATMEKAPFVGRGTYEKNHDGQYEWTSFEDPEADAYLRVFAEFKFVDEDGNPLTGSSGLLNGSNSLRSLYQAIFNSLDIYSASWQAASFELNESTGIYSGYFYYAKEEDGEYALLIFEDGNATCPIFEEFNVPDLVGDDLENYVLLAIDGYSLQVLLTAQAVQSSNNNPSGTGLIDLAEPFEISFG
jgi:hypothetical protein